MNTEKPVAVGEEWLQALSFYVKWEAHSHYVDFKVWETPATRDGKPLFGACDQNGPKDTPEEADVYLSGYVKWDGCSSWDFSGMGHFCSVEQAENIGRIFRKLYEIADDEMPETSECLK